MQRMLTKSRGRNLADVWDEFFLNEKPDARLTAHLILQLHNSKQHEHVVASIESALINTGHSQPWMYEVLALSMRITGRPKKEIERVLQSPLDFNGTHVSSILYSAAHLTRFQAYDRALHFYRQAARLAPHRHESYILGMRLARRIKNYDGIQWGATEVLKHVWSRDYQKLHQEAENAALDAQDELRKAGKPEAAAALEAAMKKSRQRDLLLRLTWSGVGDLDLNVEEPVGSICSVETPLTQGGGAHLHDGYGPYQDNCFEEYVCAFAFPGDYRVKIRHVGGNIVGKRAKLSITRYKGTPNETTRIHTIAIGANDKVVRLTLPRGRREGITQVAVRDEKLLRAVGLAERVGKKSGSRVAARQFAKSRRRTRRNGRGVGFQPIIQFIEEGAQMTASAIISADRRYVRISVVPRFSTITDVFQFSFQQGAGGGNQGGGGGNQGGSGGNQGGGGGNQP